MDARRLARRHTSANRNERATCVNRPTFSLPRGVAVWSDVQVRLSARFRTAIPNEPVSIDDWKRIQPKGKGPLKGPPPRPHFTSLNNLFLHTGQQVRTHTAPLRVSKPRVCFSDRMLTTSFVRCGSLRCGKHHCLHSRSAMQRCLGISGRWSTSSRIAKARLCRRARFGGIPVSV